MTVVLAQEAANQSYLLWGAILVTVAMVLVVLELFIPSGGLIAAMAVIAAVGSITAFFMFDTMAGAVSVALYLVLTPIFIWAVFKFWLHSPMAKHMILGADEMNNDSEGDPLAAAQARRMQQQEELRALIGIEGETITPLRPVGIVRIGDQRIDALAESGAIDARVRVVVTDIQDNQIKVRPA